MKAIVQNRYGPPDEVLSLRDVDPPNLAGDEVLIRVRAACVHPDVWHAVTGRPYVLRLMGSGMRRPKNPIPGIDMAGVVEVAGENVTRFRSGDAVFGETSLEFQWKNGGAFAEYVSVPQDALALKPENTSFEEAGSIPTAGLIAIMNLRGAGPIKAGHRVLVNGAAGGVGSVALQIANAYGAHVTGVDHPDKLEMVRQLGADQLMDYTREDVTRRNEHYDLIFDVASNLSFKACRPLLTPTGKYVLIGHDHYGKATGRILGSLPRALWLTARARFDDHLPDFDFSSLDKKKDMATLKGLLEDGKLTPMVDRAFPLENVAEAIRHLQSGRARGRIVITP